MANEVVRPKRAAPKQYVKSTSDAAGYWTEMEPVHFVPRGVKLMDGTKKTDDKKPSIMIVGELIEKTSLTNKEGDFEGQVGEIVGVYYKPGMGKDIRLARGVRTWIYPDIDDNGHQKTRDTGRATPMKLYTVSYSKQLNDERLPVLEDTRVKSKHVQTVFDSPEVRASQSARNGETKSDQEFGEGDVADNDPPF